MTLYSWTSKTLFRKRQQYLGLEDGQTGVYVRKNPGASNPWYPSAVTALLQLLLARPYFYYQTNTR